MKYSLLFLILTGWLVDGATQVPIINFSPGIKIENVSHDENGFIIQSQMENYHYDLRDIDLTDKTIKEDNAENFFFPGDTLHAFVTYQDGYLISKNQGLYFFDGTNTREWSVELPKQGKISGLSHCGNNFALVIENALFIWDHLSYMFIATDLEDVTLVKTCDPWSFFWAYSDKTLFRIGNPNESLPTLKVSCHNSNSLKINDLLECDLICYHPLKNKLKTSFRWDSGPWVELKGNQLIEQIKDGGSKNLEFRATVNDEDYAFANVEVDVDATTQEEKIYWVLLFIPIAIIGMAAVLILRERKYQEKVNELKEKIALQQDIKKYQELVDQLKMSPHFIFNVLQSISGLVAEERNKEARIYLAKFSTMMRSLLQFKPGEKIKISEEVKFLKDYLELEKMTREGRLKYQINTNDENVDIPPMMIQPLVENALVHGIRSRKEDGEIIIEISMEKDQICVSVLDNGVGFKNSQASGHESIALDSIRKRLKHTSKFTEGSFTIYSPIFNNSNFPGTRVEMKIPRY